MTNLDSFLQFSKISDNFDIEKDKDEENLNLKIPKSSVFQRNLCCDSYESQTTIVQVSLTSFSVRQGNNWQWKYINDNKHT